MAGTLRTIGLVPLRTGGKSRLGVGIPPEQRDALVLAMLDDVLRALRDAGVKDLRILAGDPAAVAAATARDLPAIVDPCGTALAGRSVEGDFGGRGETRLRAAVDGALAQVPRSADRLIVAADLPRLHASELMAVLAQPAQVVVVPTVDGGTAVLRLRPGTRLAAQYGMGSAAAHVRAAEGAGLTVAVLDLPGGRHDVDAATDLTALGAALEGSPPGPATAAFLMGTRG